MEKVGLADEKGWESQEESKGQEPWPRMLGSSAETLNSRQRGVLGRRGPL